MGRARHTDLVATRDDVRRPVAALPDTDGHPSHGGHPSWRVRIPADELVELVEDAWRLRAPRRLLAEHDA